MNYVKPHCLIVVGLFFDVFLCLIRDAPFELNHFVTKTSIQLKCANKTMHFSAYRFKKFAE